MDVVLDGMLLEFSLLLHLQAAVEHKLITALTSGDGLGEWFFDAYLFI